MLTFLYPLGHVEGHHWDTKCGRPLGMRFHRGKLVVADGALGILRVDVDTGINIKIVCNYNNGGQSLN